MKIRSNRAPATRREKFALGLAASSGSIVVAVNSVRELGGPWLAGVVLGATGVAVLVAFAFALRAR